MKIRPVGAKSFNAGGETNMTKLRVASRNFAKAPKIHDQRFKHWTWPPPNSANTALQIIYYCYVVQR